jgi:predicted transposase YbfD/YdcC
VADRRSALPDLERAETVEKAHGRIETRRIAVRPPPARLDRLWPGLLRICRIERIRERKTYCERQVIYAITSLPPASADAAALLDLARAHWQIENRLHRVKDGTFAEDACRVRSGNAPIALAHIRNCALTLIRKRHLKPKPAREAFAANPRAAIRAVRSA